MSHRERTRGDKLLLLAANQGCDAAVISTQPNLCYFSGYTGSNGTLILGKDARILVTDFRYREQARQEVTEYEIVITDQDGLQSLLAKKAYKCVGFENETVPYAAGVRIGNISALAPLSAGIDALRAVKDAEELDCMRRAAAMTDAGFAHMLRFIRPGQTERDIALELEFFIRRSGAGMAFAPIVAAGAHGAMPHAAPSDYKVRPGDLIVMDFGASVEGYCSDMTRTVAIGELAPELNTVYNICKEAQAAALSAVAPGKTGRDVDAVARGHIASRGYGEYFGHGLGHGLGLDIHEWPRLSQTCDAPLEACMAVTVEPGIYLPGRGGVRIEDTCILTPGGREVLFTSPKELVRL